LVGGDAHADAGPADQNAALDPAFADRAGDFERVVRVIDAPRVVRAGVDHLVAVLAEQRYDALFDGDAAMIATDGDFHFDTDARASAGSRRSAELPATRRVTVSPPPGRAKDGGRRANT